MAERYGPVDGLVRLLLPLIATDDLVPPPGLEPGTCGLEDRRIAQKIRRFGRLTVVPAPLEPGEIAA
ncbi:hypothetical protein MABM_26580 [Mycobacteroides abscessus]|nr:hypothetical protein MABM_26580 [Mycobacteroides abscessus]